MLLLFILLFSLLHFRSSNFFLPLVFSLPILPHFCELIFKKSSSSSIPTSFLLLFFLFFFSFLPFLLFLFISNYINEVLWHLMEMRWFCWPLMLHDRCEYSNPGRLEDELRGMGEISQQKEFGCTTGSHDVVDFWCW